jgi:hypothetical protein
MIGLSLSLVMACSSASSSGARPSTKKTASDDSTKSSGKTPTNTGTNTGDGTDKGSDNTGGTGGENDNSDVGEPNTGEMPNVGEPADPGTNPTVNFVGGVDTTNIFTRLGEITGWAVNKDNLKEYLSVNVYFDGDNKTGKKVGTAKANLVGVDDDNGGEHAFIFYVPKESITSKPQKIYIYAVVNSKEVPLAATMPYTMTFYKPKGGTAEQFYKTIGFESKCNGCHQFDYDGQWHMIAHNGSGENWTSTANYLYEKINRHNSRATPCNLLSCDKVKQWWEMEFGN